MPLAVKPQTVAPCSDQVLPHCPIIGAAMNVPRPISERPQRRRSAWPSRACSWSGHAEPTRAAIAWLAAR
jgi:hypothetical protein